MRLAAVCPERLCNHDSRLSDLFAQVHTTLMPFIGPISVAAAGRDKRGFCRKTDARISVSWQGLDGCRIAVAHSQRNSVFPSACVPESPTWAQGEPEAWPAKPTLNSAERTILWPCRLPGMRLTFVTLSSVLLWLQQLDFSNTPNSRDLSGRIQSVWQTAQKNSWRHSGRAPPRDGIAR